MNSIPAIDVRGLNRSFGGLRATANVSFSIQQGTVTALIGPNGAGKTTVFNLITNLFPADSGEVDFHGTRIDGLSPVEIAELGLIRTFQTARVFPGMTVLENLLVGRHHKVRQGLLQQMLWLPSAQREEASLRERAEALLDLVGLSRYRDTHAADLPMGAKKLVEVLRALMAQPSVLLLDEPAAGLNDTETAELAALLLAIRETGITILVVEHNMSLVMGIADQIVVLEAGAVIAEGTPDEIQRNPRVIRAYLGEEVSPC
ncbi:ABC transporter ATP-binding protein [Zoogloea oryzae]|uniref:ABC transporter ATP-binding protein n=1 Tax=Zoogloea oryzae TaxID=310767 RepID=A0ABQ6F972_9RHOO|nr:ABC transporter ATP-binding protein [Zoogloea oryzae]GLT22088.1 ABC transporter ATP-binding protein [Zoogloea oryzae]